MSEFTAKKLKEARMKAEITQDEAAALMNVTRRAISEMEAGIQLANMYGFTTQNPSCYEVCSNEASTKQRKVDVDGRQIIVYKPVVEVSKENRGALQFLDLMSTIDRYSEISGDEFTMKIKNFISTVGVDFEQVKKYLSLFPDRVYRNIYQGGLMNELV